MTPSCPKCGTKTTTLHCASPSCPWVVCTGEHIVAGPSARPVTIVFDSRDRYFYGAKVTT